VCSTAAAHLLRRLKSSAECGPLRLAENQAQVVVPELNAPDTGRFAIWHAGDGTGNGRGGAASPAIVAAVHKSVRVSRCLARSSQSTAAIHAALTRMG
jgi:hypothetical protein